MWVAISSSRRPSQPRDRTQVSLKLKASQVVLTYLNKEFINWKKISFAKYMCALLLTLKTFKFCTCDSLPYGYLPIPEESARSPSQRVRGLSGIGCQNLKGHHDRRRRHAKRSRGLGQGTGLRQNRPHWTGGSGPPSSLALVFPRGQEPRQQDSSAAPQGFLTVTFREEPSGLGWSTSGWSTRKSPDVYAVL